MSETLARLSHDAAFFINPFRAKETQRTTCIKQGFGPPLKPKIESYFKIFSLNYFIR